MWEPTGACVECDFEGKLKTLNYCKNCFARLDINTKTRASNKLKRIKILEHYGKACACCGEHREQFLQIDHIFGGGTAHRKKLRSQIVFYNWIIRNHYPKELRILCANCNHALGKDGVCPHDLERYNYEQQ